MTCPTTEQIKFKLKSTATSHSGTLKLGIILWHELQYITTKISKQKGCKSQKAISSHVETCIDCALIDFLKIF